jgi:hypothetical protein
VNLRAENLLQIRPIQADGVGCRGERLDFEKVLPVHKVGPEDGVVKSVRLPVRLRPFGLMIQPFLQLNLLVALGLEPLTVTSIMLVKYYAL